MLQRNKRMQRSTADFKSNTTRMQTEEKKFECRMDYQKAFDRVPHSWIIKSLELLVINNTVIAFTKKVMTYCRTCMGLHAEDELIQTEDMKIECGIFQGDSLSAHLFCICLFPLNEL